MTCGNVFKNNIFVGVICRTEKGIYIFKYDEEYLKSNNAKAISVNLRLQSEPFESTYLFSFFANMLAEGELKDLQCKKLRIDKDDDFARLLKTTSGEVIGSIKVIEQI